MHLCDLHCDTAVALYQNRWKLADNRECAVSLHRASVFDKYIQCAAVYTDSHLTDEQGWQQFFRVRRNFLDECEKNDSMLCTDGHMLRDFLADPARHTAFVLTVEDARILDGQPERLGLLYDAGVRLITPVWGGNSCIGGAHNTENGLTDFGKNMVEEALSRGMIVDISHASLPTADAILTLAGQYPGQVCASHSNAYALTPHRRNLTDEQLRRLVQTGGIVGINLYVRFLSTSEKVTAEDVLRHIEYCIRLCGEDHVAFGCDFDGAETPEDLPDIASLPALIPGLHRLGYSDDRIEKLFYKNACRFLTDAL
ncbi:MAG: membrane dipeptidase [Clostridia bacterium]|nr:membrane dipeptidase [Clostridia bacterium]